MSIMFWLSILLIIAFGTLGSVLFKSGTNQLGSITFDRLLQIEFSSRSVLYSALLVVSLLLFFYSGYSLRGWSFAAQYLFSPIIFAALVLLAVSRFLVGVPLSVAGLGRLTAVLTALGVVATAIASNIVFKESFSPRVVLGIALGLVSVVLIGEQF